MDSETLLKEGLSRYQSGRLMEAKGYFTRILDRTPEEPNALHMLGVLAMQAGEMQEAAGLIERALRHNRKDARFHTNLGECYRLLGRPADAIRAQRHALKLQPNFAQAYCNLGNALQARGQLLAATSAFRKAIGIDPGFAQAHYNLGNLLSEKGDFKAAAEAFGRATEQNPNLAEGHYNLGNSLAALGQPRAALAAYERAIEVKPDFADAYFNLANTRRRLDDPDGAREAYLSALSLDPSMAVAHVNLAIIEKRCNRLELAADHCRRALDLDPDLAEAHSNLGHVHLLEGELDDAVLHYRRAVEIDPDFAAGYIGLAAGLSGQGHAEQARESARRGIVLKRTSERPALGRALGKVVVLKGIEDGPFTIGELDNLVLFAGLNNADTHFDTEKLAQCDFYLDGIGTDQAAGSLPECDLIFNAVSDPDAMPLCHESAKAVCRATAVPVVNHPDAIDASRRDTNYALLSGQDGILFPKTLRISAPEDVGRDALSRLEEERMGFPLLLRRAGTHTGESLQKIDDKDAFESYCRGQTGGAIYASEYVDFSGENGLFVKMRAFAIDGHLYPAHLFISSDWYVRGHDQARRMMLETEWMVEEKRSFLRDPESYLGADCYRALTRVPEAISLDYFGIDFTRLPDGRLLIFEANSVMNHHYHFVDDFPFQKEYLDNVTAALNKLIFDRMAQGAD